jgi:hypothetical protein
VNQHFVPKFLIEGFVNDDEPGNRGVWVYRASDRQWSKRPTKKTAALEDFYTFVEANGVRDDTQESFMGKIEKEFAPILRDAIAVCRQLAPPQPFDLLVTFCALLICRNPNTAAKTADALVRRAKELITETIATEESFQATRTELRERAGINFPNIVAADRPRLLTEFSFTATKASSLGFAMLMLQRLPEDLAHMAISFYHTSSSRPFVTSDVPYAMLWPPSSPTLEQLIVPLSATIAAVFDSDETPVYRHREASDLIVRRVNANILGGAREFLISRDPNIFPDAALEKWSSASPAERANIAHELGA